MKRGRGKKKGNRGERQAVKFFNKWFGSVMGEEDEFHRTPASGGLHWRKDNSVVGDIIPPESLKSQFPFAVEVKNVKHLEFEHLIDDKQCNILKFWTQAKLQAEEYQKIPLLLMRDNCTGKDKFYVVMEHNILEKICKANNSIQVSLDPRGGGFIPGGGTYFIIMRSDSILEYDMECLKLLS